MARKRLNRLPPSWISKASVLRAPVHLRSKLMICNRSRESGMESNMPENDVISRAKARKAPSTPAGEFVGEGSSLFGAVSMVPRLQARQSPSECRANTDTFLQFCWLSHFSLLWCLAAVQCALLIASTTRVTQTTMCGMATKMSTTNVGRSKTHRDHRELKKRHADGQKKYWTWRHDHHDDEC
jgi:hypothetical protein